MLSNIKVGDMVKTAGGIIGRVNKITDKGEVKTFVLETGSKTQKSYLEMDITMIYCVLNKTTAKPAETEEKVEDVQNEVVEEKADEIVEPANEVVEEPKKKTTKSKTASKSTKKTTSKKSTKKTQK